LEPAVESDGKSARYVILVHCASVALTSPAAPSSGPTSA